MVLKGVPAIISPDLLHVLASMVTALCDRPLLWCHVMSCHDVSRDVLSRRDAGAQGHGDRLVLADSNFPSASVCGEGSDGPRQVTLQYILQTSI